MRTLRQIAQEAIRLESGGDVSDDSKFSEAYTIMIARQAANKLISPLVFANLNNEGDRGALPLLIVGYQVDVTGTGQNRKVTLPEAYNNYAYGKGLYGIAPIEDPTNHFIPRNSPSVSRNLPCADLEPGQNSYYTEGLTAYFDENMDFKKVLVKVIMGAPSSIGVDDSLPIYPELEYDIIMLVRQMLRDQPIQDKILDGNADIGVKING